MQLLAALSLLTAVTLTAAAPFSLATNPLRASLGKRDETCAANAPRLTESRVADIINELTGEDKDFTTKSGTQNDLIICKGGTGVFLNVDPHSPAIDQTFNSVDIGNEIKSGFSYCYSHDPSAGSGDKSFAPAYQVFGSGYSYLVHGSAC